MTIDQMTNLLHAFVAGMVSVVVVLGGYVIAHNALSRTASQTAEDRDG